MFEQDAEKSKSSSTFYTMELRLTVRLSMGYPNVSRLSVMIQYGTQRFSAHLQLLPSSDMTNGKYPLLYNLATAVHEPTEKSAKRVSAPEYSRSICKGCSKLLNSKDTGSEPPDEVASYPDIQSIRLPYNNQDISINLKGLP